LQRGGLVADISPESSFRAAQEVFRRFREAGLDRQVQQHIRTAQDAFKSLTGFRRQLEQQTTAVQKAIKQLHEGGVYNQLERHVNTLQDFFNKNASVIQEMTTGIGAAQSLSSAFEGWSVLAKAVDVSAFLSKLPDLEQFKQSRRRHFRAAQRLARAGWLFPRNMTPDEIIKLVRGRPRLNRKVLDQWFEDYYHADRGRRFRTLVSRLRGAKRLAAWQPLLRECLWAYERRRYRVVTPALLPVVEGLVAEAAGVTRQPGTKVAAAWRKGVKRPRRGFLIEVNWSAAMAFLASVWQKRLFDSSAPRALNRHWALHGRRPAMGTRADALRLLVAVDFIADTVRELDQLAARLKRAPRTKR
jgi:hypothetical protein